MFDQLQKNYIIYIIDDDMAWNNQVKTFLCDNNLNNIKIFDTAEKAINNINKEGIPDLVVIDAILPGINGIEASQKIKKIDNTVTIICVGSGDKEDVTLPLQVLASGCDDWQSKIDNIELLINKIYEWIKIKEKQLQIKRLFEDRRRNKRLDAISILETGL